MIGTNHHYYHQGTYHHYYHQGMPTAWVLWTLSHHLFLSAIAIDKYSRPVILNIDL